MLKFSDFRHHISRQWQWLVEGPDPSEPAPNHLGRASSTTRPAGAAMPRNSGASAAEKGETIAGAKDAQTRTKSPSNASHAASVIASVLKKPPPSSRGSLRAETARSAADAYRDVRAQTSHGKKAVDPDPTAERSQPPPPTTAAANPPPSKPKKSPAEARNRTSHHRRPPPAASRPTAARRRPPRGHRAPASRRSARPPPAKNPRRRR